MATGSRTDSDKGQALPLIGVSTQLAGDYQGRSRPVDTIPAMSTLECLGAAGLQATITAFRDAVRANQGHINRLNVYPVPDGDTGTNMARTLDAVVEELAGAGPDVASVCKAISHGSLM